VNKEMHTDISRRPTDEVRRKRPEKWRTNSYFLLHDNAPAHWPVLFKGFLSNNSVITLEHPPYSPELVPHDFFLFPQIKLALTEQLFCVATDIKNAMKKLKRLSQHGFQEFLQHLRSRWQKCTVAKGDCFEGNVVQIIVIFCISQK
jgi:hypothetical protein